MTELEQVKQDVYNYLFLELGYSHEEAKRTVETFVRVTGYFRGKPSRVLTKEGIEVYI